MSDTIQIDGTTSVLVSPNDGKGLAEGLNRRSQCVSLNREVFVAEVTRRMGEHTDSLLPLLDERPQLFAGSPIFIDDYCLLRQRSTIAAVEKVVAMPSYRERVLAYAPTAAQFIPNSKGVFLSYDFHPSMDGPRLFEINTNAGGGLLTDLLIQAQKACSDRTVNDNLIPSLMRPATPPAEQAFLSMFLNEWRLEKGDAPLRSIAIVDETPENQFLYPEFLMFERLFKQNGIDATICEPKALEWRDEVLWQGQRPIDLVYNRLTDFGLESPSNACLREAYLNRGVVVTPHPRAHALYADKRNLALLTDEAALLDLGVDSETINLLLQGIAHTRLVFKEEADELWAKRKRLFFKPVAGYGGKGAYRGDKLTRRVFEEILQGDYVAQALVPPGERLLRVGGELTTLKFDVRHYVYCADTQLTAARIYQGQTTNFRTPGGGFSPVIVVPSMSVPVGEPNELTKA